MSYSIELRPQALRVLRKLDPTNQARVQGAIILLSRDPRPPGARKLQGREGYRVRVRDFPILYTLNDSTLAVLVVGIGHRRNT